MILGRISFDAFFEYSNFIELQVQKMSLKIHGKHPNEKYECQIIIKVFLSSIRIKTVQKPVFNLKLENTHKKKNHTAFNIKRSGDTSGLIVSLT